MTARLKITWLVLFVCCFEVFVLFLSATYGIPGRYAVPALALKAQDLEIKKQPRMAKGDSE